MALEWLDGVSVVTDLQERRAKGMRGRPLEEVVKLFQPAAHAIAYAHSQGVIHRDIKPGNLFLANVPGMGDRRRMKVLDFGLAKILNDDAIGMTSHVKTMAPFFFCSPSYGAPEQFDPMLGELGPWTDVYAFAMVLIEALTDTKARPATNMAEALAAAMDPRNKPTPRAMDLNLGEELEGIFSRALSQQPKQRWPDAQVFWDEFKNAAMNLPPMTQRLPNPELLSPHIPGAPRMPSVNPDGSLGAAVAHVPVPPGSVPSAAVYQIPRIEPMESVAEIHVDAEAIKKASLPPPFDPSTSVMGLPKRTKPIAIAIGVVVAFVVVATVVGLGIHLASSPSPETSPETAPTSTGATTGHDPHATNNVATPGSASASAASSSGVRPVVEVQMLDTPHTVTSASP
jgi:serine/threonine protein kinase